MVKISVVLVGILWGGFAYLACGEIVNTEAKRTIDVSSGVAQYNIDLTVVSSKGESEYNLVFHNSFYDFVASLEVTVDGHSVTASCGKGTQPDLIFCIVPLQGTESKLKVFLEQVKTLSPRPAAVSQYEEQHLVFQASPVLLSPYVTKSQSTVVRVFGKSEAAGKQKREKVIVAACPGSKLLRSGDGVKLGPIHSVPPYGALDEGVVSNILRQSEGKTSPEGKRKKNTSIPRTSSVFDLVYFKSLQSLIAFPELKKTITISQWGYAHVEESYSVENYGASLKGKFSRLDYAQGQRFNAFQTLFASLPKNADKISFTDRIGNISTSQIQRKGSAIQVKLDMRYPIVGGWRADFVLSYRVPTQELLSKKAMSAGKFHYALDADFSSSILGAVILNQETQIVLPENSEVVEYKFSKKEVSSRIEHGDKLYIDVGGRPTVFAMHKTLSESLEVGERRHTVHLVYEFKDSDLLREPALLFIGFFLFFLFGVFAFRFRLTITPNPKQE